MSRLVAAELLKLRTTRTFWGLVGTCLVLVVLATALQLAFSSFHTKDDVRSLLSTAPLSGLFLLILGVVFSAGEYRHGTIAWTLLVTPSRLRALSAKVLAVGAAGLAVGLIVAAVTAAIALPWLPATTAPSLSGGQLLRVLFGGVVYTGLAGALSAGIGSLLRNQVAAIVVLLCLVFVVDPALAALAQGYGRYSLAGLGTAITGSPPSDAPGGEVLPFASAVLLWTAYTCLVFAAAVGLTSRRDV
jgi:ABC-2 type transport system permease protein